MTEAPHTTRSRLARTDRILAHLNRQFEKLWDAVGGKLEPHAMDLVPEILERDWRMVIASVEPESHQLADRTEEFPLVVRGSINGRLVTVFCKPVARVSVGDVRDFVPVVRAIEASHPDEDIRALFFGYKADRKARELIVKSGAAMVFTRGVMIPHQTP